MAKQGRPTLGRIGPIAGRLFGKKSAQGVVGLNLSGSQAQGVHVLTSDSPPSLQRCDSWPVSDSALAGWASEHNLTGAGAVIVPPEDACILRVIDAPDLPREEWIDSVRWQVQDLVEFDVSQAWIDVVDIPVDAEWTRTRKIYVAIGDGKRLTQQIEIARRAGLKPLGFEPRERALMRAAQPKGETGGVAVLHLSPKGGLMVVGEGGEVYVTRPLQVAEEFTAMEPLSENELSESETGDPPSHPVFDALLLDLQRSLDYYETEFGRSPVSKVVLAGGADDPTDLAAFITATLRLPVEVLDLATALPESGRVDLSAQAKCLEAFGAALSSAPVFSHELAPKAKTRDVQVGTVGRVSAIVAVAALLQWGAESYQAGVLDSQVSDLQVQRDQTTDRLNAAVAAQAPEDMQPAQLARLSAMDARRRRQQSLLETLSAEASKRRSFAEIQSGLAAATVPGVWLTEIRLTRGGQHMEVVGQTRSAALVPRWIEALEKQEALAGVGFEAIEIERSDDGLLRFELRAHAGDGAQS